MTGEARIISMDFSHFFNNTDLNFFLLKFEIEISNSVKYCASIFKLFYKVVEKITDFIHMVAARFTGHEIGQLR